MSECYETEFHLGEPEYKCDDCCATFLESELVRDEDGNARCPYCHCDELTQTK